MKRIGATLMILGALIGVVAGTWVILGLDTVHLPWLVSVGLVKLIVAASFGIMGAGAMLTRIARKAESRARAELGSGVD